MKDLMIYHIIIRKVMYSFTYAKLPPVGFLADPFRVRRMNLARNRKRYYSSIHPMNAREGPLPLTYAILLHPLPSPQRIPPKTCLVA